jgi:hypothetical protein
MGFQQWFESMRPKERKQVVSMLFAIQDGDVPEGYRSLFAKFRMAVDDEYHALKGPYPVP